MRGLLEEAHAHLERARYTLERATDEALDDGSARTLVRIEDLANEADNLASRVSNLVREVRP